MISPDQKEFDEQRRESIQGYNDDLEFKSLSVDWVRASMGRRYVYHFDWLGLPVIQLPQDIVALQEIVWQSRPDVIIETGVARGGSLLLSASMLALLDYCDAATKGESVNPLKPVRKVIGIELEHREQNKLALENHPLASKITVLEGSSIDSSIVEEVKALIEPHQRVMVCLDSMHTEEHVRAELEYFSPLVTSGCYLVVFDTWVESMPPDSFPDRPWDVGNNPMTAVRSWLPSNPDFVVDDVFPAKLQLTSAPGGYLRRL